MSFLEIWKGSKGDVFDNIDTETLYERLNKVDENYTADDLIAAVDEGF